MFSTLMDMFTLQNGVMMLTAFAAFATIITILGPMMSGDKLGTRMKYVATEREALRVKARENLARERMRLRQTPQGYMKQLVDKFSNSNVLDNEEVKNKLRQAGFRGHPVSGDGFLSLCGQQFWPAGHGTSGGRWRGGLYRLLSAKCFRAKRDFAPSGFDPQGLP